MKCTLASIVGDVLPPNVVHLILTDNALTHISVSAFQRLTKVRKLMLANNKLTSLPGDGVRYAILGGTRLPYPPRYRQNVLIRTPVSLAPYPLDSACVCETVR